MMAEAEVDMDLEVADNLADVPPIPVNERYFTKYLTPTGCVAGMNMYIIPATYARVFSIITPRAHAQQGVM